MLGYDYSVMILLRNSNEVSKLNLRVVCKYIEIFMNTKFNS